MEPQHVTFLPVVLVTYDFVSFFLSLYCCSSLQRIAWPGGRVTHNKPEALFKFLLRKQAKGEELSPQQMSALKNLLNSQAAQKEAAAAAGRADAARLVQVEALALATSDFVTSTKKAALMQTFGGMVEGVVGKQKAVLRKDFHTTTAKVLSSKATAGRGLAPTASRQKKIINLGNKEVVDLTRTAGSGIIRYCGVGVTGKKRAREESVSTAVRVPTKVNLSGVVGPAVRKVVKLSGIRSTGGAAVGGSQGGGGRIVRLGGTSPSTTASKRSRMQ